MHVRVVRGAGLVPPVRAFLALGLYSVL